MWILLAVTKCFLQKKELPLNAIVHPHPAAGCDHGGRQRKDKSQEKEGK